MPKLQSPLESHDADVDEAKDEFHAADGYGEESVLEVAAAVDEDEGGGNVDESGLPERLLGEEQREGVAMAKEPLPTAAESQLSQEQDRLPCTAFQSFSSQATQTAPDLSGVGDKERV